jgi:hypothetical protein
MLRRIEKRQSNCYEKCAGRGPQASSAVFEIAEWRGCGGITDIRAKPSRSSGGAPRAYVVAADVIRRKGIMMKTDSIDVKSDSAADRCGSWESEQRPG